MFRLVLILILLAQPVVARVGERYDDFARRVGKAERRFRFADCDFVADHQHGGRKLSVDVWNGAICSESHAPVESGEIDELLAAQNLGPFAPSYGSRDGLTIFRNRGAKQFAMYDSHQKKLSIIDSVYRQHCAQVRASRPPEPSKLGTLQTVSDEINARPVNVWAGVITVVKVLFYALLMIAVTVAGLYVICWLALLLHEAGHFFAARGVDVKVASVTLGTGPLVGEFNLAGARWEIHCLPTSGSVEVEEGMFAYSTRQLSSVVLGGPLASLLLASLVTWLFYPQVWGNSAHAPTGEPSALTRVSELSAMLLIGLKMIPAAILYSTWGALLLCLIPMRIPQLGGAPTDGLQLWWLWFSEWRWKALLERFWKSADRRD